MCAALADLRGILAVASPRPSGLTSLLILSTLAAIFGASSVTYWLLVRRWTSHRQWVALSDWARPERFRRRREPGPPAPFDAAPAAGERPRVRICLSDGRSTLLQLEAAPPAAPAPVASDGVSATLPPPPPRAGRAVYWNVLIRAIESDWPPTGLRPVGPGASVLDLFALSPFPLLGPQERFMVWGTDPVNARAMSNSAARALLPPDIGILLHGRQLVLDFSSRPFDPIEFNRMRAVAEQLMTHLPAVRSNEM